MAETSTLIKIHEIVALVTGGGSGLGRATVERLIKLGAKGVCAFDLKFTDKFIANNVVSVVGSVVNEDDVNRALEQCSTQFGRLDVVVNCAGIPLLESIYNDSEKVSHSLKTFQNVLEVNTIGTFNVNRLSLALMSENEAVNDLRGVLINVASITALDGPKGLVAYNASKAAVFGMTLPIARDVAHLGIRCVTIAPGAFQTAMENIAPKSVIENVQFLAQCPKKLGQPEEFAHLVQTIIENPMLNGEVIRLDAALRSSGLNFIE